MKKLIATGVAAASIVGGSFAVAAVSPLGVAGAQDDAPAEQSDDAHGPRGHIDAVLDSLVEDATITGEQRDAIVARFQEHRAEHRAEREERRAEHLSVVADALGITTDELAAQLSEGASIADIAGDDVDAVIAALVAEATARIDEAVASGELPQERADQLLEQLEERITDRVNGERPGPGEGHGRGRGRGPGPFGGPGGPVDGEDATA